MLRVFPITKEKNAQQRYPTRFAAMWQDRFYVSVARFTVALKSEVE